MAQSRLEDPSASDLARSDDLPVGAQLAWRLRVLIASGQLRAGDRLPGVRELAVAATVNVNTARAVYRRLEDDGLIVSRQGLGTFVADDAPASPELERLAADAAESARASGVDPRDLARAIYAGSAAELPVEAADERPGRNELRRQIARLESLLASYPDARKQGEPTHPLLRPKGHIADMAELERTRDELLERLRTSSRGSRAQWRAPARGAHPAGEDDHRSRGPQMGDGLQGGDRRARLRHLGGRAKVGPGGSAHELVASQGLVGMSITRAV